MILKISVWLMEKLRKSILSFSLFGILCFAEEKNGNGRSTYLSNVGTVTEVLGCGLLCFLPFLASGNWVLWIPWIDYNLKTLCVIVDEIIENERKIYMLYFLMFFFCFIEGKMKD